MQEEDFSEADILEAKKAIAAEEKLNYKEWLK